MDEYINRTALMKWGLDSMDAQRDVVGKAYCAEFLRAVRQVKAADVAPVVHGRWVKIVGQPHVIQCDVCGSISIEGAFKYCHSCGAKMDLE